MSKHRKTWSSAEKLQVINYAKSNGNVKAAREFGVSVNSIYNWLESYAEQGEAGLRRANKPTEESEELSRLRRENQQLKELVAEKELRLRINEELLKKSK
jgi:putative transposase